jgi:acyl-CoA reductase-like NAD-dependent aldehyde dehydrogenase
MDVPFTDIDRLYIDGEWQTTAEREPVLNPATEAVIGEAPVGDASAAEAAIAAAHHAFEHGPWPRMKQAERAEMMKKMHAALVARREQLVSLILNEVGCAQGITRAVQVDEPIKHLLLAAQAFDRDEARSLPPEINLNMLNPTGPKVLGTGVVVREPVGVVTGITGYNFPFLLNMAKVTPALLAGNTLVLKPSPFTPYTALMLGEVADEIGLPKGVLNVVTGGPAVGTMLTSDPRIDMVTFTGSEAVGAAIMGQAAPTLKRVHLELGGKSALIVRDDADVAAAAAIAIMVITVNCGQGCAITSRFLVHNSVRRQFVETARAIAGQWKIGDASSDPSVLMGPLIRESQRSKVERLIQAARDEGATLVHGGGRPKHLDKGFFTDITLFDDVDNTSTIAQEEVFGPVGAIIGFDTDDEAVRIANESNYGLGGAIMTADPARAYEMALRIRTGTIAINGGTGSMAWAPFGGYKRSGIGREYGPDWMREFQQEKTISFPAGR